MLACSQVGLQLGELGAVCFPSTAPPELTHATREAG